MISNSASETPGCDQCEGSSIDAHLSSPRPPDEGSRSSTPHIAIIGSGSAAFACAIRAAERGARVTMIEGHTVIGGTCVNIGCVPSKILIRAAQEAHTQAAPHFEGIRPHAATIDREALIAQQQARVTELRQAKYLDIVAKNPAITLRRAHARFVDDHTLNLTDAAGREERLEADRFLIAVGASPSIPDVPGLRETPFLTSSTALTASETPRHLLVLGASAVALELAQAFRRLGSEVTIVARGALLSREDPDLGLGLQPIFEEEGIRVLTDTALTNVHHEPGAFTLTTSHGPLTGDQLLVATGVRPNTDTLGLALAGVRRDAQGAIMVDDHLRTNVPHVYAGGDCSTLPRFVYVAAAAGTRAAMNMTGADTRLDLEVLPAVVFTDPQVASVGLTAAMAQAQGLTVDVRALPLENVPRALANFDTRGFIKLVAERPSGRLLGAQILAPEAGEIIQSAAIAMSRQMTVEELADQIFPYLTMVEGLKLCAQTFTKDIKQLSCCAG
ncbi:MAG: mercury(II) reductase [Acidiferrobacter sp.]